MRLLYLILHLTTSKSSSLPSSKNNLVSLKVAVEEAVKKGRSTTKVERNFMVVAVEAK
jgi:hypothetical protein